MSMFLVIKPNGKRKLGEGDKVIKTFPVEKIVEPRDFILQHVGTGAEKVEVGDYVFWINDYQTTVETNLDKKVMNLFLNEQVFACGDVMITANKIVSNDVYAGVDTYDLAKIINAFKSTTQILVDDEKLGEVTVDRVFDSLLTNHMERYMTHTNEFEANVINDVPYSYESDLSDSASANTLDDVDDLETSSDSDDEDSEED